MSSPPTLRDRVALVTVHYRGVEDLRALLDGLPELDALVVDNSGRTDETAAHLPPGPGVRALDAGGNVGFARGANLGAGAVDRPFVLFANPDSRPRAAQVTALLADLDAQPDAAAVAPAVLDAQGEARGGGGRLPSVRGGLAALLGPLGAAGDRIWATPGEELREVEWLSGACLLVRRSAFLSVGGFDEHYPLYNEDMALGARLRAAGHRLLLDGRVRVDHPSGGSSTSDPRVLWRARGGALGHFVLREVAHRRRLVQGLLAAAFALRSASCVARGDRTGAGEWWTYAVGVLRAKLPVLAPAGRASAG